MKPTVAVHEAVHVVPFVLAPPLLPYVYSLPVHSRVVPVSIVRITVSPRAHSLDISTAPSFRICE